jgi:hypothetical protein
MTMPTALRSSARIAVLVAAGIVLGVVAVLGVRFAIAKAEFDAAQAVRLEHAIALAEHEGELDAAISRADAQVALAEAALDAAPVGYVSEESAAALADARDRLAKAVDAATRSAIELPAVPAASLDAGALWAGADRARDQAAQAHEASLAQEAAIDALDDAEAAHAEAGAALLASARSLASTILPANPSVANQPHVAFLQLQDSLAAKEELDDDAVALLAEYVEAANSVSASHAAEEAEKAGPLYGLRAEVEAYARSISGGVLLDFNWQPIVIGYSMAGTATIESSPPYYYSTITLTNSIADNWGDTVPVSLVTHEVGHAITSKCMDLFDSAFEGNYERWATAWAMSWGYPGGPSGGYEYGFPSDEQVAIAGQCR